MKRSLKKYRALGVIFIGMIFNVVESVLFAQNGNPFNLKPLSVGEWVCDIIATLIVVFGFMMATYDMWSYKPKKTTRYKRVNGEVVEVIVEE